MRVGVPRVVGSLAVRRRGVEGARCARFNPGDHASP
jgi:hypothetical protein